MTTVGAKVQITGTSGSAVAALNATTGAAGRLNTGLGRLAGVALTAGAGVLGFGAATESARRLVQLARQAVTKYAEENESAQGALAGTKRELDKLQQSVGGAIVGGRNLEMMTGGLNIAVSGLTRIVDDNAEALQALALNGFTGAVNGALTLARGMVRAVAVGSLLKHSVIGIGDSLAYAASSAVALAYELSTGVSSAMADFVENADGTIAGAHPLSQVLGAVSDRFGGVADATDNAAAALRGNAAGSARTAATMWGAADAALEGLRERAEAAGDAQLQYGAITDDLNALQAEFNRAMEDGSAAAASYSEAIKEAARGQLEFTKGHTQEEKDAAISAARLARLNAEKELRDRLHAKEAERLAFITEKRAEEKAFIAEQIKDEIDLRMHLDAIKTEAFEADQRRREAEQAATSAAIDGTLAGFGRLASGNDKLTKALNIAAGARLAGQAVFQLNTGVGYALAGSYAQGVALIAQSVVSFAEAAKLGFGGGKKGGGGARQTTTTVNQTNVFAGPVDSDSSQGFLEQLQSATRAGALEGAR